MCRCFFLLVALLVIHVEEATAAVTTMPSRFVICPTCKEDADVWYYAEANQRLYYIDINWPAPWGGKCPSHNVSDIKPLLQRVDPAALAGIPGRLVGGSGSPCEPPCQHFNCSLLSSTHWAPPPPPPPLPADEWSKLYRNWTYLFRNTQPHLFLSDAKHCCGRKVLLTQLLNKSLLLKVKPLI